MQAYVQEDWCSWRCPSLEALLSPESSYIWLDVARDGCTYFQPQSTPCSYTHCMIPAFITLRMPVLNPSWRELNRYQVPPNTSMDETAEPARIVVRCSSIYPPHAFIDPYTLVLYAHHIHVFHLFSEYQRPIVVLQHSEIPAMNHDRPAYDAWHHAQSITCPACSLQKRVSITA